MGNLPHGFDIYLGNVETMKIIAEFFVAFSEKLNFTSSRGSYRWRRSTAITIKVEHDISISIRLSLVVQLWDYHNFVPANYLNTSLNPLAPMYAYAAVVFQSYVLFLPHLKRINDGLFCTGSGQLLTTFFNLLFVQQLVEACLCGFQSIVRNECPF